MARTAVLILLLANVLAAPAFADRLGGAYRGPYGPSGGGVGGRVAALDVLALWPFWFEKNKEWILAEWFEARRLRTPAPEHSSSRSFGGAISPARVPLTDADRDAVRETLVGYLDSESSFVRDAAVLALGKLGGPEVVAPIASRLADPDLDVREDALLALGLTRERTALAPLLSTFRHGTGERRAFAALGLALHWDRTALPVLLEGFETLVRSGDDDDLASAIATAIGAFGDGDAVEKLARPLELRGRTVLRVHVCQALGRIPGEKAKKSLLRALTDKDPQVGAAAALALGPFSGRKVQSALLGKDGLKSPHRMTSLFAILSLGHRRDEDGTKILRTLAERPQRDRYKAQHAAIALGLAGDRGAHPFFREILTKRNRVRYGYEVHAAAAIALGLTRTAAAATDLREIATRGRVESDYRGYAALALGLIGDRPAKAGLERVFLADDRKDLLRFGCWAVGLLGDRTDLSWLLQCLQMEGANRHFVRGAAAVGIGLLGDRGAVGPLLSLADSEKTEIRAFALAALGRLVDRSPVPRIPLLLANQNYRRETWIDRQVLSIL